MSEIESNNLEQKMSLLFQRFSKHASDSPLYKYLSEKISNDKDLLLLAAQSEKSQPAPNLFFASVNYLLAQNKDEELTKFYPNAGGIFEANNETIIALKKFCEKYREEILLLLKTRLVQTNEIKRCALLLPALYYIADQLTTKANIALIDLGASAGLNLMLDKICIQYSDNTIVGPENSLLKLRCTTSSSLTSVFQKNISIVSRLGIDRNPIDLRDSDEQQWSLALIWPDQLERIERLKNAIVLINDNLVKLIKGNGNDVLADILSTYSEDQTICIMHSFTLNQFSQEEKAEFYSILKKSSEARDIWQISLEWMKSEHPELEVSLYRNGEVKSVHKLAECQQHGDWIKHI